jgi:hypothetical protein
MKTTGYLVAVVLVLFLHCAEKKEKISFGAIRWDYWSKAVQVKRDATGQPGSPHSNLQDLKWEKRLPFFARVLAENPRQVEILHDTQAVMDQEIEYARQSGLAFWAFLYYPSGPEMSVSRELYLNSRHKSDIAFCLILSRWNDDKTNWEDNVDYLARQVQEPSYFKVIGDRPLIFLFFWDEKRLPEKIWGSLDGAKAAVKLLRKKIKSGGQQNPYLVAMRINQEECIRYCKALELDAIATYTTFGGTDYQGLAQSNIDWWQEAKKAGIPAVLPLSCGWGGPRPSGPHDQQPTLQQFENHLKAARAWMLANPHIAESRTSLMYAWNEFDEGGFLCPTQGEQEGSRKIDVLARVVHDR